LHRLLLISNSTSHGGGYLDHCADELRDFLGPLQCVLFVPYALHDHERYASLARERFARMGYGLDSVHAAADPAAAVGGAEAIFVGGGNTFRLLKRLQDLRLIGAIRERVDRGIPYAGASAGSNVACVTIKTTNDMPIVEPASLDALALVPFNINPHYLDPEPGSTHMGETREQRIREFHEENDPVVVGLREGAMLRIEGREVMLKGRAGARVFRRGEPPVEYAPGSRLNFLLAP
jgi:dipeptidase E